MCGLELYLVERIATKAVMNEPIRSVRLQSSVDFRERGKSRAKPEKKILE